MLIKTNRILMNEADASPGNGAPVAPPVTPAPIAAPTAPETPAAPAPDVNALVEAKLKAFQNEFFANARKAGLLKKDEAPAAPATPAPTATVGMSADEVRALVARETTITRVAAAHKLSATQEKWMRDLVDAHKPDDVAGYCQSFVTDLGIVRPELVTPAPAAPAPTATPAPVSDKGSPAPGTATPWQRELAERPLAMSPAARAAMDAELGVNVAKQKRVDAARALHSGLRVTPK